MKISISLIRRPAGGWLLILALLLTCCCVLVSHSSPQIAEADPISVEQLSARDAEPPVQEAILILRPRIKKVQAVVYCTHTSEEYAGQTRAVGSPGGVMEAARALSRALEERGVQVLLDESVHDSDYNSAYADALTQLEATAADHPDIQLYIDVHRDSALPGINTTLIKDDDAYARMLLIVGSDQKLEHPHWQQNRAFAEAVTARAEELAPGIMFSPRIYSGRYNQHLGTQALLVEIGSTDNTVEEACRSAELLAEAIVNCL